MNTSTSPLLDYLNTLVIDAYGLTLQEMGCESKLSETPDCTTIHIKAGFPILGSAESIQKQCLTQLMQQFPQQAITMHIEQKIPAYQTQMPGKSLRGVKNTIAIASGKGGVGKSTVTVNLAAALLKAGARVGILDADIYGPSMPMMLGACQPITLSGEHYIPAQAHGLQAMSIGYLTKTEEQALLWRGPMLAKALLQMLDLTLWDDLDYLLIDLPPGTGDIQLSLVQKIPLTAAIVVTTPQNIATLDAQKALQLFEQTHIDVIGIIENMSTHICTACGHEEAIFGSGGAEKIAGQFQVPLLGRLPLDTRIRECADQGTPIALLQDTSVNKSWTDIANLASILLAQKTISYAHKFPPIITQ